MNKPEIIIIGAGGHARACIDVIEQHGKFKIAGLVGKSDEMHLHYFGHDVIATDKDMQKLVKEYKYAFIAIGQINSPNNRTQHYQQLIEMGFQLPTIISPSAIVSRYATIGSGTIIMNGCILNAGVKVGLNSIINTSALLEHDVKVGDHCHVSTGTILNGDVTIGSESFIGSGSVIKQGVSIGKNTLIGMGLSVRHDQPDNSRFVGKIKV
jgi:sugar O-acyltransferase (sialic acid O-acetyltransferase NeuD family)